MAVLLAAEWDKTGLSNETAKAYTALLKLDMPIDVLLAGKAAKLSAARGQARHLPKLRKALIVETDNAPEDLKTALAHGLAEPFAALLQMQAQNYDIFAAASTTWSKNIMPRLAGLLDVAQISDIIEIVSADVFKRPIYAGNIIETVRALDAARVLTIRASHFPAPEPADEQAPEEILPCSNLPVLAKFKAEHEDDNADGLPDLGTAKIIVSGGRGFGSAENFKKLLEPLALRLNAAIGASRVAVDLGFAPNDRQVGQTGRTVAPQLYFAIGISGAAQHLAGMMDSGKIVAINSDAEAPIFQVADYGLAGDLNNILPELTVKLSKRN